MPRVDRVGNSLPHEVRPDRPAAQPVSLEQLALRLDVAGIGDRPVDLEVVAPAGELDAVEAPASELGGRSASGRSAHWPVNRVTGRAISASFDVDGMIGMLSQSDVAGPGGETSHGAAPVQLHLARRPACEHDLDRCASAGRPVGSQGRPARQRINVLAFSPTKARRPSPRHRAAPTPRARARARAPLRATADRRRCPTSETPSSSPAAKAPEPPDLAEAPVGDQLDDVAGRVVEVARLRIPVREVEHDLARLQVGKQLDALPGPGEHCRRSGRPGRAERRGRRARPARRGARAPSRPPRP